jgi:hypothetical protein
MKAKIGNVRLVAIANIAFADQFVKLHSLTTISEEKVSWKMRVAF